MDIDKFINKYFREEVAAGVPTNNASSGAIAGLPPDTPPVKMKKKPPILARGKLPGARTRFKQGADFITNLKKNKYT